MTLLNLKDGGHLKYKDAGSGPPIVLLHGWGMCGEFFGKQVADLSSRFRIVVPDFRGHGDSSHLVDGQDLPTLVADVTELIVSLDLSQAILVGWSMGAMVAWGVMQTNEAGRISGLATIDMVPRLLNDEDWQFGLRREHDANNSSRAVDRMRSDWTGFTRNFVPRIFARGDAAESKQMIDSMVKVVQQNHPESMARLWESMAEQDFRTQLGDIEIPVLVTYGQLSQIYSEEASEWLADELPNARRVGFADSGHAPHLEEPDLFNQEIEKFADEIKEQASGRIKNQEVRQ